MILDISCIEHAPGCNYSPHGSRMYSISPYDSSARGVSSEMPHIFLACEFAISALRAKRVVRSLQSPRRGDFIVSLIEEVSIKNWEHVVRFKHLMLLSRDDLRRLLPRTYASIAQTGL